MLDKIVVGGEFSVSNAKFYSDADFRFSTIDVGSFSNAKFFGIANFVGTKISSDVNFDGTTFAGLHRSARVAGTVWICILAFLLLAIYVMDTYSGVLWLVGLLMSFVLGGALIAWSAIGGAEIASEAKLSAYESSFRILKRIAAEGRNTEAELLASSLELKASRMRIGHNRPWGLWPKMLERIYSVLYEVLSDYGRSLSRPLLFLVASIFAFGAIVWAWEGGGLGGRAAEFWTQGQHSVLGPAARVDPDYLAAVSFSASRALPFGPWADLSAPSGSSEPCGFPARHLAIGRCRPSGFALRTERDLEAHRLKVRSFATLQSVISLFLVFLFGLAVRRRFQVG